EIAPIEKPSADRLVRDLDIDPFDDGRGARDRRNDVDAVENSPSREEDRVARHLADRSAPDVEREVADEGLSHESSRDEHIRAQPIDPSEHDATFDRDGEDDDHDISRHESRNDANGAGERVTDVPVDHASFDDDSGRGKAGVVAGDVAFDSPPGSDPNRRVPFDVDASR